MRPTVETTGRGAMDESQGLISARTDDMRAAAQRFVDAGRSIDSSSQLNLPAGAFRGTALQVAIDFARQRICESMREHAQRVNGVGSAIVRSAENYDDGDRAFAASMADAGR